MVFLFLYRGNFFFLSHVQKLFFIIYVFIYLLFLEHDMAKSNKNYIKKVH